MRVRASLRVCACCKFRDDRERLLGIVEAGYGDLSSFNEQVKSLLLEASRHGLALGDGAHTAEVSTSTKLVQQAVHNAMHEAVSLGGVALVPISAGADKVRKGSASVVHGAEAQAKKVWAHCSSGAAQSAGPRDT